VTRRRLARLLLPRRFILARRNSLIDFIRGPWTIQRFLQFIQRVCANRSTLSPDHNKSQRTIQHRQLGFVHRARELLRQSQPRNSNESILSFLDIVLDIDFAIPNHH
jgi:hypothetical protein